jgi:hypothetical protein
MAGNNQTSTVAAIHINARPRSFHPTGARNAPAAQSGNNSTPISGRTPAPMASAIALPRTHDPSPHHAFQQQAATPSDTTASCTRKAEVSPAYQKAGYRTSMQAPQNPESPPKIRFPQ